ncbi:hypothetical protein NAP1_06910 [Erythrobacter sp. NAP1]|nr:hypothetical protein NAP1_06910 [Erythrobacter sp. NAP1]
MVPKKMKTQPSALAERAFVPYLFAQRL